VTERRTGARAGPLIWSDDRILETGRFVFILKSEEAVINSEDESADDGMKALL
jgi:hypothetical protein